MRVITFRSAWCDRACRCRRRPKPAGSSKRRRNPEPASRSMTHCRSSSPAPSSPSSSRRHQARWVGASPGSGEATNETVTALGRRRPAGVIGLTVTMFQQLDCSWHQWCTQRTLKWIILSSSPTCYKVMRWIPHISSIRPSLLIPVTNKYYLGCARNRRKYFFSHKVVGLWNVLDQHTVDAFKDKGVTKDRTYNGGRRHGTIGSPARSHKVRYKVRYISFCCGFFKIISHNLTANFPEKNIRSAQLKLKVRATLFAVLLSTY